MGIPDLTRLAPQETGLRLGRLRAVMTAASPGADEPSRVVDGLLVTSLTHIRYLTGFTGSAGMLFVLPDQVTLLTDGRYATQAPAELARAGVAAGCVVAPAVEQRQAALRIIDGFAGRLGLEAAHVSWARQRALAGEWWPDLELVPTVGLVEGLRRTKDAGEVDRLAAAAGIADAALAEVRPALEAEPTEIEFATLLDAGMRRLGASAPSFATIVASGDNAAMPHHRPGPRRIRSGEVVVVDFGATYDGYHSDMTRTLWSGTLSDPVMRRAVEVVADAQAAGVSAVGDGVPASHVDGACRAPIAAAGWAEAFVHGTGHGVGLEIHEAPAVAATSPDTLAVGHVVTVEPGVYLPGRGGVRIEDTVVVTSDGCTPLTSTPKDLP